MDVHFCQTLSAPGTVTALGQEEVTWALFSENGITAREPRGMSSGNTVTLGGGQGHRREAKPELSLDTQSWPGKRCTWRDTAQRGSV